MESKKGKYLMVEAPETEAIIDFIGDTSRGQAQVKIELDGHKIYIEVIDARTDRYDQYSFDLAEYNPDTNEDE